MKDSHSIFKRDKQNSRPEAPHVLEVQVLSNLILEKDDSSTTEKKRRKRNKVT